MTATAHAIIGTAIAAKVGNPALAIPLALASHIIADRIPHWDTATNKKSLQKKFWETALDVVVGFIISFFVIKFMFPQTGLPYTFIIILFAQSFDWLMAPWYFFGIKQFKIFYKFQKTFDRKLDQPWGIVTQAATIFIVLVMAKLL